MLTFEELVSQLKSNDTLGETPEAFDKKIKFLIKQHLNFDHPERKKLVIELLKTNTTLLSLEFGNVYPNGEDAVALGEALKLNRSLTNVSLKACNLDGKDLDVVLMGLEQNKNVKKLFLWGNHFKEKDHQRIAVFLCVNHSLTELEISFNNVTDKSAQIIANALSKNYGLKKLDISWNEIGNDGIKAIAQTLFLNRTLQSLVIGRNKFGFEGIQALASVLEVNLNLTELDLSNQGIGVKGATVLCTALKKNKTLKVLGLNESCFEDVGACDYNGLKQAEINSIIASLLAENQSIQRLTFELNNLGDQGAVFFSQALLLNKSLTYLDINCNYIRSLGISAIGAALKYNQSLTFLNLGYNFIGSDARNNGDYGIECVHKSLVTLVSGLSQNTTLKELRFYSAHLDSPKFAKVFAPALEQNKGLTSLKMRGNAFEIEGAKALLSALRKNHTLIDFEILGNELNNTERKINAEIEKILKKNALDKEILSIVFETLESIMPDSQDIIKKIYSYEDPDSVDHMIAELDEPATNTIYESARTSELQRDTNDLVDKISDKDVKNAKDVNDVKDVKKAGNEKDVKRNQDNNPSDQTVSISIGVDTCKPDIDLSIDITNSDQSPIESQQGPSLLTQFHQHLTSAKNRLQSFASATRRLF